MDPKPIDSPFPPKHKPINDQTIVAVMKIEDIGQDFGHGIGHNIGHNIGQDIGQDVFFSDMSQNCPEHWH